MNTDDNFVSVSACEILDFSNAALGVLSSPKGLPGDRRRFTLYQDDDPNPQIADGAAVINGVALPENVILQLRQLGIPITWYSVGELEDAVEACAYDDILIDDGNGLEDELTFTARKSVEREKEDDERRSKSRELSHSMDAA